MQTVRKPTSLLSVAGSADRKCDGIKDYAWNGVPADSDGQLIHHYDKNLNEAFNKRQASMNSDGLPCSVLEVPPHLYVNSDMR